MSRADHTVFRFYLWSGVPAARALSRVALDHNQLRSLPFARLLCTSSRFDVASTDLHRWLMMVRANESFDRTCLVRRWDEIAAERASLTLRPMASRGTWGGVDPFGSGSRWDGPVLSLTHARLTPWRMHGFSRALSLVTDAVLGAEGLRWTIGFGEFPIGFKGTLSAWSSSAAASDFAFRNDIHIDVIRRTPSEHWYLEELFTRFALLDVDGTINGNPAVRLVAP